MTHAIIGSGNVGTALARRFGRAGIAAAIANTRGPETITTVDAEAGGFVRPATLSAALDADIILLALPFVAIAALAASRADWSGKIVIDATNAHGVAPGYLAGRLSSDIVAAALPGARVVKAFNQLPARLLGDEPGDEAGRRVVFIAGNDETANGTVKLLAERLGFAPILLGRIDEGGRLIHIPGPLVLRNLVEYPRG